MKARQPLFPPALPLALALALALGGCGKNGIGADSSVKQGVSTSTESKVDTSREVKHNTNAKATISMPAIALMMDALHSYAATQPARSTDPHVIAAREIISVARPAVAWPIACFSCSAQTVWARQQAARVGFANLVLTETAQHLQSQALADPAAARKAIITAFLAIPPATLDAARQQALRALHGATFTPDFSGGEGVHFLMGASDFKGGPAGWAWAKNGVTWYGDGALSGQKVELALDSAIDTGTTETSGTGSTTGTEAGRENTGQAGVK